MRKKYDIIEDIIIYHYSLYSIPNYLEQFSILGLTVCEKCVQKSSFAKVYKEAWSKQFFLQTIEVQNNFLMYQLYQHFLSKKIENGRSVYYYHAAYSLHCSYLYSKQLYVQKSADVCIKKVISVLWSQVLKLKIERTCGVCTNTTSKAFKSIVFDSAWIASYRAVSLCPFLSLKDIV